MKKIILKLIDYYQKNISPYTDKKCRFEPTCSNYAKQCFLNFNFFYASFLTLKRFIKCNRFSKMAYDPIPEKRIYKYKYPTLEDTLQKLYYDTYDSQIY